MITNHEIRRLEEIKDVGKRARYAALLFIGISMLGGIPVRGRPAIMVMPSAMLTCLALCGVCWFTMMTAIARRMRARCPRCRHLFFGIRKMSFLPLGLRALWGNRCGNCGLSLRELRTEKIRQTADAILHSGAVAATAQNMAIASVVSGRDLPMREYVTLKQPRVRNAQPPAQPASRSAS